MLESVGAGSCLAFGSAGVTVLWNLRFDMPESQECSTGHIGSGPWMDPGTIRPHCAMPTILWCHRTLRQVLGIPMERGDIGSNMG